MFSTTTENALLQQESLPKFASIEPSQLTPAVTDLVDKLERDFASFESKIGEDGYQATYENVMPELEKMQFPLGYGESERATDGMDLTYILQCTTWTLYCFLSQT